MNDKVKIISYSHKFSIQNKLGRLLWTFAYFLLFRPFATRVFKGWRAMVLRAFGAKLGLNTHVYASVRIWAPWNLELGDYSTLGPGVDCYNQGRISIGSNATISQKSYLCASSHDISDPKINLILCPIRIEDQVWIAADAFIGPNVTVGEGVVVGARSAVFRNVEPWTVVGGNPAKVLKKRLIRDA